MSSYKLSQYHRSIALKETIETKPENTTLISVDKLLNKYWLDYLELFTNFECLVETKIY